MRVLALQLLAVCQLVCASPCKPSSSSASVALSATSIEASSTAVVSSSTIADETETSTTPFPVLSSSTMTDEIETVTTFFTELTAVSETETASGSTTDVTSDSAISTILITTSSTEPTTLATSTAEPTTTTTAAEEPTNVITNPGFDSGSTAPWYTLGGRGTLSFTDEDTHSGEFSGHFYTADYISPVVLGIDHPVDASLIKADTEYHYSIWIKTSTAVNCQSRRITCGAGGGYISGSDWAGPYNEWTEFTMSCTWSQMFLDMVPSIQIRAECQNLEFYVDDAVLIEAN
ncbi:uncharacterized protein FPRO_07410 [Fusarium proliferatum ET1]|uniref:CBM-cenC domain-containing protein n=2 Tax=Gibberella intermedia TaxID=948311 RepID=A0A1L7VTE0_FUSPR|nr:uncharacterized protein FPRO_07410 [Fusarium proliferatum ET1]RKL33882.1 hypothetical protein BFJ72_g9664 [Fusarium proliferatum]CZR43673.1 uncharacterized protein FPRO_07410 [Fusarium proliferatum ET1]